MGIIRQQTIKSSVYYYLGILIGFLTLMLQPHALKTDQVGLISILTGYSLMFAQLSMLGFNGTTRYFPYFRNHDKKHNGYLFLSSIVSLIGLLIFIIVAYVFKDVIISENAQKTNLFNIYYWYLVPLIGFTLFFNVFFLFSRMLYDATTGTILNEFVKRVLILIPLILIYLGLVGFKTFMSLWLIANILPTLLLVIKLKYNKQLFLAPNLKFLDRPLINKLTKISVLGILTGSAPLIVQNIDTFFVNKKYGLGNAGIYSLLFYFGTVINIPTRALYNIAFTFVTEAWKNNDLEKIIELYKKSCINQLISAVFLFILIWANVGNILHILPPAYAAGKFVLLFVCIGYTIDSAAGINSIILGTSRYYKYESFFYVLLAFITIFFNILLIPRYGITGSAIAYALALLIFNLFRYLFLLYVFKMQPFTIKSPVTILISIVIYGASVWIIPSNSNFIVDIILRSAFITLTFGCCIYYLNLSVDINLLIDKYLVKLGIKSSFD